MSRMQLNDTKAGMQGLDKEKINKIIHDISKGIQEIKVGLCCCIFNCIFIVEFCKLHNSVLI